MTPPAVPWWRLGAACFLAPWLVRLVYTWTSSPAGLLSSMPDDACYYLQVAAMIAEGGGSSFDGLRPTNGYHPLWLMILGAMARVLGGGAWEVDARIVFARVAVTLGMVLALGAVATLAVALHRWRGIAAVPWLLALAGLPWVMYAATDGMESALTLVLLAVIVYRGVRDDCFVAPPGRQDVALGALLSLLFLARLDTVFLCVGFGVLASVRARQFGARWWLLKGLSWGLPVALVACLYIMGNMANFGAAMPISGALKTTFPHPGWRFDWLLRHPIPMGGGLLAAVLVALGASRDWWGRFRDVMLALAGYVVLHAVYTIAFSDWAVHTWHFTGYWVLMMLVAGLLGERLAQRPLPTWAPGAMLTLALVLGLAAQWRFLDGRTGHAFQARSHDAALWAREHLGPGQLIGMSDCGVFGYVRGGLVVNLDGVVNDRAYQDALVGRGIAAYIHDSGIDHIAHHAVESRRVAPGYGEYVYTARSHLYNQPGGSITLQEADEVHRSAPFDDGRGDRVFVIWRVRPLWR